MSRRPVIWGAEAHGLTESVLAHTQIRAHTRLRTANLSIFTQCDRLSRESADWRSGNQYMYRNRRAAFEFQHNHQ